jgi:hypothetical protein
MRRWDWDSKRRPTLKRVLAESIDYAFALGVETGRRDVQESAKKALGL